MHVRDASIAANSGIKNKGKFLGLTETGTTNAEGLSTGLDHLKELGVTHVHLLPSYDFYSVDETKLDNPQYNWGYDPLNYNTPEGSYSTDPANGAVRIKEFKQLIKTFHENGLRVVMDVVYNHTMLTEDSYFNQLVPGYYYRQTADGKFSNATACNNETASERAMMRKFMLESVKYWVKEYHVDGFRFDLMGVHDIVTMNLISSELHKIKPDILLYGEGWTAGACPLPDSLRAIKANAAKLDRIAVFSDDIRDGIKGSVFENKDRGFASNKPGMEESIKFGIVAACKHPQVDYSKVNYSKAPYAAQPYNTVTYAECHDNHVLWDKLAISAPDATEAQRKQMHKLALSIVLTSQGISFLHAGTEFLRSKKGNENSYNAGDSINAIDWSLKSKNKDVVDLVKGLIKMRKEHPAFRMTTAEEIAKNIQFLDKLPCGSSWLYYQRSSCKRQMGEYPCTIERK
ncbi:MAG: type I pullulanase [Bacteroidota bacterium]